jgi:urease accessory protein
MTLVRPFELADGRILVQLIALGPGLCAGDAIEIDVTAEDGARVVVTTTAATRIMSMDEGRQGEQHVRLSAGGGAWLEYYPAVTIPFPGSALTQTVRVEASPTSRVGVLETWAMGRGARDEYLQFRRLSSHTTLHVAGTLTYGDAMLLEPASVDAASVGVLAGRRYAAAGFWFGASLKSEPETLEARHDVMMAFAQSTTDLVYLRALASDGPALDAALRRSVERVSDSWGVPGVRMDRFHS